MEDIMGRGCILFYSKLLKISKKNFQRTNLNLLVFLIKKITFFTRWENYCFMKNLLDFYQVTSNFL